MDLLFKRYANPFFLLDGFISTGRLREFIEEMFESKKDDEMWEFYLHKVYGKSFEQFLNEQNILLTNQVETKPIQENLEATVKRSWETINTFIPNKGGEINRSI